MIIKSTLVPVNQLLKQRENASWNTRNAFQQVDILTRKTSVRAPFWKEYLASLAVAEYMDQHSSQKSNGRDYDEYNSIFKPYLKRDLLGLFCEIASLHKGRPIRILDDGAGYGEFIHQVKLKLSEKGIASQTMATALRVEDELRCKDVDFVYEGSSILLVPEKKQDVIISLMGTLWYMPRSINKELILKHAYSLEDGGYLLLATAGLLTNVDPSSPGYGRLRERADNVYSGIRRSLEKRGFEVICACDVANSGILIVRKVPGNKGTF